MRKCIIARWQFSLRFIFIAGVFFVNPMKILGRIYVRKSRNNNFEYLARPIFNKISRLFYEIIVLEVDENFCNFFFSFY